MNDSKNLARFAVSVQKLFLLLLWLFAALFDLNAQTPPASQPMLRLETGMHTERITGIAVDRTNRWVVTSSTDKTVRIWDLASSALIRTLRVPISSGEEGELYQLAFSPDGKTIAVSGQTGYEWDGKRYSIYLFDRESGRIVRRIGDLPRIAANLTFSPDGMLFAFSVNDNGVRIHNTTDYTQLDLNNDCVQTYDLDFDLNSHHFITACKDYSLRLYTVVKGKLKLTVKKPTGSEEADRSQSVKFSPDGSKVAVSFPNNWSSSKIQVLSASDLSLLFLPEKADLIKYPFDAGWSGDGTILNVAGESSIYHWTDGGRGSFGETIGLSVSRAIIQPLRTGGVVYGINGEPPSWGVIDSSGKKILFFAASTINNSEANKNYIYTGNNVYVDSKNLPLSNDGSEIGFNYELNDRSPTRFSIIERNLNTDKYNQTELQPRLTGIDKMNLSILKGQDLVCGKYKPESVSEIIKSPQTFEPSTAVAPSRKQFLYEARDEICLFDQAIGKLWNSYVPSVVRGLNISGDGRLAVAALDDGTIRWYRMTDGKELLAFFPHKDKKRWVLWTPTGYYDASPNAEELIGWHVNNGKDAAADFFPVGQFRQQFYRPDVIDRVLKTLDETTALQQANEAAGRKTQSADIARQLPPVVEIVSPRDGTEVSSASVKIGYTVRTSSGEPVTDIKVLIDGRRVAQERGAGNRPTGGAAEITVTIPEKDSEVAVIAENRFAPSVPAVVKLRWKSKPASADEFVVKPKLYILAIGVSKYANADYDLGYAAKDAKDFAAAMQAQQGGIYREVVVKLLTDAEATRDNIVDGLDWIRLQTTAKDVAMVFMAGHGTNDTLNRYYFLPHNFNADRLASTGVTFTDIKNSVEAIAGKAVYFVDTCHSGNAVGTAKSRGLPDINGFVNELSSAENGAIVFAASTGKQVSLEDATWNNGAFTKALVEGLTGRAQIPGKGKITINSLDLYISERVKELTKGQQTPTTAKPNTVPDFPVAAAKF